MPPGGKRKQAGGAEPANLRRFKEAIIKYTEEASSISVDEDARFSTESKKGKRSRKEVRKEKRMLVKMRRNAFQQHKELPTVETLAKERADKEKVAKKRKKMKEKRKRQRERKREKKQEEEEEAEAERQRQEAALHMDDRAIKEMEKNLKLNKRKNKKTLPQAFINDGLDYLLDAVDSEKLKDIYEREDADIDDEDGDGIPTGDYSSEEDDSDLEFDDEAMDDSDEDEDDEDDESNDLQESGDDDAEEKDVKKNKKRPKNKDSGFEEEGSDIEDQPAPKKLKQTVAVLPDAPEKGIMKSESGKGEKKKGVKFSEDLVEVCKKNEKKSSKKVTESESKKTEKTKSHMKVTENEGDLKEKVGGKVSKKKVKQKDLVDEEESSDEDMEGEDDGSIDTASEEGEDQGDVEVDDDDDDDDEDDEDDDDDDDDDDDAPENDSDANDSGEDKAEIDGHKDAEEEQPALKEDIYGRLRDKKGNVVPAMKVGGYVPPGKRLEMAQSGDEKKKIELERMKKQLKGLMNRLSESNLQSISNQIEEMYRTHSRAYLSESLTSIILQSCISPSLLPDRLLMEQAMLLSVLHGNVGSEVGAVFLQSLAQKFDETCQQVNYGAGKEMDNILVMLSHLYNFKVVHSLLMMDILKKLMSTFAERDIELILVILKNVGFSLRKDDPVTLKEIIVEIQTKASTVDTSKFQDQSRVRFMLEVLMAIRNNNMRKIPNYDPSHLEHLRKLLRSYTKGAVSSESQLRISLEDLLLAKEKGRWWLVGSAWTGRETDTAEDPSSTNSTLVSNFSSEILELARQQRMNTDIRKNIFCIIMTAEDFVDAFEKLLRLRLKTQQEREIIHVIMDLCMQEKVYNPFYSILAQKFCEYHRRFLMTVQFNTWDKLKILNELSEIAIDNLAGLIAHLIALKTISLSVFKVVEFSELDKSKLRFIRRTLNILLLDHEEYTVVEVFTRVAGLAKLRMLREGLKVFMNHFLLRNKQTPADVRQMLKERILLAEKALSSAEAEMRL